MNRIFFTTNTLNYKMKSFFAIALAALSVDAVRLQLEQAAHNVGCDFKDAN